MSRPVKIVVLVCTFLLGALFAGIVLGVREKSLAESLGAMFFDIWGVVTLLDLYVGLLFVATWIAWLERRWWKAALWIAALASLGNVVTLVYILLRARKANSFAGIFLPSITHSAASEVCASHACSTETVMNTPTEESEPTPIRTLADATMAPELEISAGDLPSTAAPGESVV